MQSSSISTSNARNADFPRFLARSLERLREECPAAYAQMCRSAPGTIATSVDGEEVALVFAPDGVSCAKPAGASAVRMETTGSTILDLVWGRSSLYDATREDRCLITGSIEDVAKFYDTLLWYLRGAVRSPSFPWLLREYEGRLG